MQGACWRWRSRKQERGMEPPEHRVSWCFFTTPLRAPSPSYDASAIRELSAAVIMRVRVCVWGISVVSQAYHSISTVPCSLGACSSEVAGTAPPEIKWSLLAPAARKHCLTVKLRRRSSTTFPIVESLPRAFSRSQRSKGALGTIQEAFATLRRLPQGHLVANLGCHL